MNIVLFPTGTIKAAEKQRLEERGIIAIECDEPSRVVNVIPGAPLVTGDEILEIASEKFFGGVVHDLASAKLGFVTELGKRIASNAKRARGENPKSEIRNPQ
jgi:hypothetical protein